MENLVVSSIAPLPLPIGLRQASSGIPLPFGPVLVPSNPWRILPEVIPVDAEMTHPMQPTREVRIDQSCARSLFRRGEMTLDATGFTLLGTGIKAIPWLKKASVIGIILSLLCMLAVAFLPLNLIVQQSLHAVLFVCFCISLMVLFTESLINERFRTPMEIHVPWSQVKEMQSSFRMDWAILIYCESSVKSNDTETFFFIPINSLSPAVMLALQDAVEAYVPGKLRLAVDREVWTTGKLIAVGVLLAVILTALIAIAQTLTH